MGKVIDIDGRRAQMLHGQHRGPARPIATPLWVAPSGPVGYRTARELEADGVILVGIPEPPHRHWPAAALMVNGIVLEPGEDHTSARVIEGAGPWFAAMYHGAWEVNPELLDHMPGGPQWREVITRVPDENRHLAIHNGHLTGLGPADRAGIEAAGPALLETGWTGPATSIHRRSTRPTQLVSPKSSTLQPDPTLRVKFAPFSMAPDKRPARKDRGRIVKVTAVVAFSRDAHAIFGKRGQPLRRGTGAALLSGGLVMNFDMPNSRDSTRSHH
ncbi:hypothetical protein [Mycobacterium terramassiliense]|uniref:hypothetical protein n=1 Tax=Mycobacterium terramassiliense TaxID=1841859 RepID=UPI0012FF9D75|nr:hypothetical protein [Mycobacterium terramassiliense]